MTAELRFPGKRFQSMMTMRESRQRGVAARLTSIGVRTILLGLLSLLCSRTQAQVTADFAIASITLSPTNPERGQAFNASVTVKNQGSGPGDAGWLDIWAHQPSSQACGADGSQTRWVGLLANGGSRTLTFKGLIAPASVAPWTFRAFVDSNCATIESNETNNQATASYGKSALLPDLVINSVSITPTNPQCGQSFCASITIKNQGNGAGDAGWLDLWTHQPSSQACGAAGNQTRLVGLLAGGGSRTLTVNGLIAPATGAPWTFRAFIDSTCATTESNESNNQASLSYGRCDQLPDLVVTSISLSPPTPRCAQLFKASVTVRNQGRVTANGGWLDIWKNGVDKAGCGGDGDSWQPVGVLAPGQSRTYTFPGLSAPTNGTPWTFRAFVDSACAVTENSESNNQLTKTYGECLPEPDFLISVLSVSPSVVRPGVRFTAYVSLENQGSAAGDAGWVDVWVDLSKSAKCSDNGGAYQRAGTLLPGAKRTLTFTSLLCGPAGLSNVLAFVDSGCATAERNENNNQLTLVYSSPTNSLKQTARLEELTDSTQKDAVVELNLSTAASATPPKPTREELDAALTNLNLQQLTGWFLDMLASRQDPELLVLVQQGLARVGDTTLVNELARRYEAATSDIERENLADALRHQQNAHCVPGLVAILNRRPVASGADPLGLAAADTLGIIGDPVAVSHLLAHLWTLPEGMRSPLFESIGRVSNPESLPLLASVASGQISGATLYSRLAALQALSNFGSEQVAPILSRLMREDPDSSIRAAAASSPFKQ